MERGRVAETELMPKLVEGHTELGGGNLKKRKGFLEPNFGVGLNQPADCCDMLRTIGPTSGYISPSNMGCTGLY